jgi:hypothetical protein
MVTNVFFVFIAETFCASLIRDGSMVRCDVLKRRAKRLVCSARSTATCTLCHHLIFAVRSKHAYRCSVCNDAVHERWLEIQLLNSICVSECLFLFRNVASVANMLVLAECST